MDSVLPALIQLFSSLVAVILGLCCNYWLQQRVNRRRRAADELKQRLYDFLELAAAYWISSSSPSVSRRGLEAKITTSQHVILAECNEMAAYSKKLGVWHCEMQKDRLDLMDAVTGGVFQQRNWQEDPQRVTKAAIAMINIVHSLYRAC